MLEDLGKRHLCMDVKEVGGTGRSGVGGEEGIAYRLPKQIVTIGVVLEVITISLAETEHSSFPLGSLHEQIC